MVITGTNFGTTATITVGGATCTPLCTSRDADASFSLCSLPPLHRPPYVMLHLHAGRHVIAFSVSDMACIVVVAHTTIECALPAGEGQNKQVTVDVTSQTDNAPTAFSYQVSARSSPSVAAPRLALSCTTRVVLLDIENRGTYLQQSPESKNHP